MLSGLLGSVWVELYGRLVRWVLLVWGRVLLDLVVKVVNHLSKLR